MNRGYVKVWRKIEDSGLMQLPNTLALFLHILFNASYKDRKLGTPNGVIELKRGQYVSGRKELANRLKQSEQEIRTSLNRLENLEIITIKSTSKFSIYTIENYGIYQDYDNLSNQPSNQQLTSIQPSDNQQSTTNKESNNINIKKDNIPYGEIVDQFNEKLKRLPSIRQLTDKRKKAIKSIWSLSNEYQNLEFYKIFFDQVNKYNFLFGENNSGWTASFDWIFNKNNFVKILEGNYQQKNKLQSVIADRSHLNKLTTDQAYDELFGSQIVEKDITHESE